MNGFGPAPSVSVPSSASAPSAALTPATTAPSTIIHTNAVVHLNSNNTATGAAVAPSPFSTSSSSSIATPLKQFPLTNTSSSTVNGTTSNTTSIPFPYPSHDTTSITGKRKRADSSPVKEPQNLAGIPPAHRQKLLSDFRQNFLLTLTEHDAGISLLDKPVSPEPNSHEAKKSKTLSSPDGMQTLRQRLNSDTFYTSLQTLFKDLNIIINESLEDLGAAAGIAPEDEMKDDDATPIKDESGDAAGRIRKFKQVAQDLITQAITQYPYLNVAEESKVSDTADSADDESPTTTERPRQPSNYKLAVAVSNGNKTYYSMVKAPSKASKTAGKHTDEMDIDENSTEQLAAQDLPPHAQIITIYESSASLERPQTMKETFANFTKAAQNLRRDKKSPEKRQCDWRDQGLETADWLYYGPFMSFCPTSDDGRATVAEGLKSWYWYTKHGDGELKRVLAGRQDEEDEERQFKELADSYEPLPIDPALFETETESEKALREISDILSDLHLKQNTRLVKHNNPSKPSKPDQAESEVYQKAQTRLVELIAKLEPEVCEKLDQILDLAPNVDALPLRTAPMPGSMPNPEKAPPPQAPMPTPAPQYTTTRVSYAPYAGEGAFTPTARVVSSRSSGHNQYTNRTNYAQQSYAQPQTPVRQQQYGPNTPYYPAQTPYTGQHRQAVPVTPQYPASGYANSPFSRSTSGTVPRMAPAGGQQVFVHGSTPTIQQPAIRQTHFITQQTSHGPVQVQTGRRVSLAPQVQQQQQPPPQQQQPPRTPSAQGFAAPYTPGHAQYTGIAQQTQQQMLRTQQQQQPQFHAPPHTPTQAQYAMYHQQQARPIQPGQSRAPFPSNFQNQVRIVQAQPGTPGTPSSR
ncbi:hypothetical protein ABW20_dc0109382 [Dactylellina cionopaga]|nr:hypothetical protein ABW20_dc0109382 [Dactylellina cionopaga]